MKLYKCIVCGHLGGRDEFNSTLEGRELCKSNGTWECVRKYYNGVFAGYKRRKQMDKDWRKRKKEGVITNA